MLLRLTFIIVFLCSAVLLPKLLCAQDRINIFDSKNNPSSISSQRKADEAARQRLQEAMSDEFSPTLGDPQTYLMFFGFFILIVLLVVVVYSFNLRYRETLRPDYNDPNALFRELCSAHQLTMRERWFLKKFADDAELENPLPLFIEPQHFLGALQETDFDAHQEKIRYFLAKLFDIHGETQEAPIGDDEETQLVSSAFPVPS